MSIAAVGFGIAEFVLTAALAAATVRMALWALDRATPDLDELAELGRGNAAVAIVHGALLLAIAMVVRRAVEPAMFAAKGLVAAHGVLAGGATALFWATGYAVLASILALIGLLAAMRVAQRSLRGIDAVAEVRAGNVAVALVLAASAVAIGLFLADGVAALIDALPPPVEFVRARIAG